MLAVRLVST